jgi:hypothetical protein
MIAQISHIGRGEKKADTENKKHPKRGVLKNG